MAEWNSESLRRLRTTLASLYPTESDARLIVEDAGLDAAQIRFESKAISLWFNILQHAKGRKKVGDILQRVLEDFPEDEALQAAKNHLPPPLLEGPEPGDWRGPKSARVLESLIGPRSTLVPITYLELGLLRARSVVRVRLSDTSSGTGFVTAGETLITNHHILPDADSARAAVAQFNYQATLAGTSAPVEEVGLAPESFFLTSPEDDWTAVRLAGEVGKWGCLELAKREVAVGEPVNIIQHAGGGPKQISLQANAVVFVGGGRLQYLTDTLPGSSGSPVFDAKWRVVALHHSGGWITEPMAPTKTIYYRNEGTTIDRVIDGLSRPA